jgi:hypothetical protein
MNPDAVRRPAVRAKKVTAAFDGGRLSSDSGVMLLALAERRRGLAATFANLIADPRDPAHVTHTGADVLRARMLAIGCGHPDGNDLDWLRSDPAFKLACGRLPDTVCPTPARTFARNLWCRVWRTPASGYCIRRGCCLLPTVIASQKGRRRRHAEPFLTRSIDTILCSRATLFAIPCHRDRKRLPHGQVLPSVGCGSMKSLPSTSI